MAAAAMRRSVSEHTLVGGKGPPSERAPSSLSGELSFSKTLSSADAFADVVPEGLSFEMLEEVVAVLARANLMVLLENEVFRAKLARESPDLLEGFSVILEEATTAPATSSKRSSGSGVSVAASEVGRGSPTSPPEVVAEASSSLGTLHATTLSRAHDSQQSKVVASTDSEMLGGNPRLAAIRAKASAKASARASGLTSKTGSLEKLPRMSFSQRADIAEEAAYFASERAHTLRTQGEARAADLRARIEEAHSQLVETKAARNTLDTSVLATGDASRASGEKFLRYMTDLIKQFDTTVGRLRLKISALRAHRMRLRADIAVKQELGEALCPVDFDKIRIEIEEYNRKIENKNKHLIDLKNISGSATSSLLASKKRLSGLSRQLEVIRRETVIKRNQMSALEHEEKKVLEDVGKADLALNAIRRRMEKQEAPDVLEYVRLKHNLDVIRRDCTVWERRCKIQQQTVRDLRRAKGQLVSPRGSVLSEAEVGNATDTSSVPASPEASAATRKRRPRPRRPRRRSRSRDRSCSRSSSTSATHERRSCHSNSTTATGSHSAG